jgi:SWI/SNF-related matrix-associated actin-dependent regulator of chromatin subfamily A-like protein 1
MNKYIYSIKKKVHSYFVIGFPFDEDIVSEVKSIPSATYNARTKEWLVRISPESSSRISKLLEIGFEATEYVMDLVAEKEDKMDMLRSLSNAEDAEVDIAKLPFELHPFQKAGVKYMISTKKCFNGDDMGLGKTIQAIASMETMDVFPHIVICPNRVKKKWRREISKWLPHRSSIILDNNNFYYGADILILNYEAVTKFLMIERRRIEHGSKFEIRQNIKSLNIKGITIDESHYLKNPKSKRTKAVKELCKDIEYIWMLSGTIVNNRPEEIISQLQIMNRLHDFGGYQYFIRRYCDSKQDWDGNTDAKGARNLVELNKKLKERCMVRRTKIDVRKELPGKVIKNIPVEIDNREEYEIVQNDIFEWIENNRALSNDNPLGIGDDLPIRRMAESAIELQILNALRMVTARGKVNACIKWIDKFLKTGQKLVVFANHIEIQQKIITSFPGCARILGNMSPVESDKNELRFKKSGCNLIVCSLKGANTGIDLVSSNNYFCVELDWTPSTHDQAEDRLNRIGQHRKVNCYYPLAVETIDEDIFVLHQQKRSIMSGIMDGKESDADYDIRKELIRILKEKGHINIPA